MVDWQVAAVVVAVASVPLVMSPVGLSGLSRAIRWLLTWFHSPKTKCDILCWEDLSTTALHSCNGPCCVPPTNQGQQQVNRDPQARCYHTALFEVLNIAWPRCRERKTAKPHYLSLERSFLRTDGNTLLVYIVLTSPGLRTSLSDESATFLYDTFTFSTEIATAKFHRYKPGVNTAPYLLGHLHMNEPRARAIPQLARGITKSEILSIVNGYPPFYRSRLTTHSGVSIEHPVRIISDVRRAGWLIATGLSVHDPVLAYNGAYQSLYTDACSRVQSIVVEVIQPAFQQNAVAAELCRVAANVICLMNKDQTGSGVTSSLVGTVLEDCTDLGVQNYTRNLTANECQYAIDLFQNHRVHVLNVQEARRLEPILPAVLAAAICGTFKWWNYYKNKGSVLPEWLLTEAIRSAQIWLSDCRENDI